MIFSLSSTAISSTRRSRLAPQDAMAAAVSLSLPMVTVTPSEPKSLAAMTGEMQMNPIGLPAARTSRASRSTWGMTFMAFPSTANVQRFLAAPNPPTKMRASRSPAPTEAMSTIWPRTIRADSTRTLLRAPSTGALFT